MARPITHLEASPEVLPELRRRSRSTTIGMRDRERAAIILLRLEGVGVEDAAARLKTTPKRVSLWSRCLATAGLPGLDERPGRAWRPSIPAGKVARVTTEATRPPGGRSRYSIRSTGRHADIPASSVQRIWSRNDSKPHPLKTFKLSSDPPFEKKFWDVIGPYLGPPAQALVLFCDEKSQCQVLERTQLGLPLASKRPRTMTHDYIRHGTVTLFAALNQLTGRIIARTEEHHTYVEWLRFLKQTDRERPRELSVHLIADNYATHKHPQVRAWLDRQPRFNLHFTPTSSSWLNMVERFFAGLTGDVIRAGSFTSARDLMRDTGAYLAERNASPQPYVCQARGADIPAKITGARAALAGTRAARAFGWQL